MAAPKQLVEQRCLTPPPRQPQWPTGSNQHPYLAASPMACGTEAVVASSRAHRQRCPPALPRVERAKRISALSDRELPALDLGPDASRKAAVGSNQRQSPPLLRLRS